MSWLFFAVDIAEGGSESKDEGKGGMEGAEGL